MYLDSCAVQRHGLNLDADDLSMLHSFKNPIQHTRLRPTAHAGIDGVPSTKPLRQATPLAALLGNVKNGIQNLKIREADISALTGQTVFDQLKLGFGDFHAQSISYFRFSVNKP